MAQQHRLQGAVARSDRGLESVSGPEQRNRVPLREVRRETRDQALDRLFEEHASGLRAFVAARVVGNLDVEDIVQDVYARLARMEALAEKLPPGNRGTRAFLLTMANRLVIDRERHLGVRRQHREQVRLLQDRDDAPSPERIVLARDDLDAVARAIEGMKPRWRRAFVLNRFNYMSYRDVARTMNVSPKTVEKYIGKALLHLRSSVLGELGE